MKNLASSGSIVSITLIEIATGPDKTSNGRRNSEPGMSEPYFSDVFISSRVTILSGNAAGITDGDLVEACRA